MLEIDECFCRPESLSQLLAGDEFAGTIQQGLENLKRLIGEIDPDAGLPQLARAQIQLERAKADERIQWSAHSGPAVVDQSTDAPACYHAGYLEPYLHDSSKLTPLPRSAVVFTSPVIEVVGSFPHLASDTDHSRSNRSQRPQANEGTP